VTDLAGRDSVVVQPRTPLDPTQSVRDVEHAATCSFQASGARRVDVGASTAADMGRALRV
jgi:hypothetical protein